MRLRLSQVVGEANMVAIVIYLLILGLRIFFQRFELMLQHSFSLIILAKTVLD